MKRTYSVLIVEDEQLLARSMGAFLTMNGISVRIYEDGHKARKALANGEFDVIITDLGLPSMDGFELIREAEKLSLLERVVVISGEPVGEKLPAAVTYIKKPFDLSILLKCVKKCIKRSKGMQYLIQG